MIIQLFVIALLIYLMFIHTMFLYMNKDGKSRKEKIMMIVGSEGNFHRLMDSDMESPSYVMSVIYTFEWIMEKMGVSGEIYFDDSHDPKYRTKDGSKPRVRGIIARILTGVRVMLYPF